MVRSGLSGRATGRWAVVVVAVSSFVMAASWAFASPPVNGPDEIDHTIRAIATAHGHLSGHYHLSALGWQVDLPVPPATCDGILHGARPCQPSPTGSGTVVETNEFRHPPLYYAVVGAPSLVVHGAAGDRLLRLVSALFGAALVTAAFAAAMASGRRITVLAVAVAATPVTWFLIGSVNPNGLEIAAAIALWTGGLVLATSDRVEGVAVHVAGAGATALVVARAISPLWAVVALVTIAVVAGAPRRRELARRRDVRVWTAVVLVAVASTAAWIAVAGFSHTTSRDGHAVDTIPRRTFLYLQESVGDWLDLRVSLPFVVAAWGVVAGGLVVCGLVRARRRRWVLVALLAVVLVVPSTSDVFNLPPAGDQWQGRFGLALWAGVLVAAAVLADRDIGRTAWRGALVLLGVAHVVAIAVFVHHWDTELVWVGTLAVAVVALFLELDRAVDEGSRSRVRVPAGATGAPSRTGE